MAGSAIKLARFAIVLAILALWEVLSRTGMVNPRLLPSASETLSTLGDLLQRAFNGSPRSMLLGALSARKTSREELAEIRKLLDEYEKGTR